MKAAELRGLGRLLAALVLVAWHGPAAAIERSAGCFAPPPAVSPSSVQVDGRARDLIVAVPDDYRPDRAYPLVVAFHGRTNDNARVRRYYGLERAARGDAIFVYPAGLRDESGRFTWADPGDAPGDLRDFALFDRLLTVLTHRYCIDREAVFVVGHSLGASFANSLACARGTRIRAVATVAGGISAGDCSGEAAAMLLHNPDDRYVPVSEGRRTRDVFLAMNDLDGPPEPVALAGFDCRRYGAGDSVVLWCLHEQDVTGRGRHYPHQWPRGAGTAIMTFFDRIASHPS